MPRRPRYLTDSGYYHVFTRGNDRKKIFQAADDFSKFMDILKIYLQKYQIKIFNFCLMPNHFHLLLQAIKSADLPKFMQGVLQVYACHFRNRYQSVGFLFQNRYKSILIEKESYLLECARYIERNPVRGDITKSLEDYRWSSFLFYANGQENGIVESPNPCILGISHNEQERQQRFRELVSEERPYDAIVDTFFRI